jgi:hypothetical protein
MTKILCFICAINCLSAGWFWTGILLLWVCFGKSFK